MNSEKERLSIATFYSPRQDGVIGPWPSLITKQTPAQFKLRKSIFHGHENDYCDLLPSE